MADKDKYHHGNLREELIGNGIRLINEYGEEALSLRKVAAACGVSHAAPYAHFAGKEELLEAIKDTVNGRFMEELEDAVNHARPGDAEDAIIEMGKRYVLFFVENPDYFYFLFHKQNISIHLNMGREDADDYKPFLMLKQLFGKYLADNNIEMDIQQQEIELIKTWSVVQGLSSIAVMKNVETDFDWAEMVGRIIDARQ